MIGPTGTPNPPSPWPTGKRRNSTRDHAHPDCLTNASRAELTNHGTPNLRPDLRSRLPSPSRATVYRVLRRLGIYDCYTDSEWWPARRTAERNDDDQSSKIDLLGVQRFAAVQQLTSDMIYSWMEADRS